MQALAGDGDAVDPPALAGYLRHGWVPGPGPITAGVHELLPAHQLVWQDGRAETTKYWSLPPATPGTEAPSDEELSHALRYAMGSHLVADVPVGLFLSSGVDSVVLARLSVDVAPGLHTYTVDFGTADDESKEALVWFFIGAIDRINSEEQQAEDRAAPAKPGTIQLVG